MNKELLDQVCFDIDRYEDRGLKNKRKSDYAASVLIIMGILSGILIAIPDQMLSESQIPIYLRQVIPVLTAAVYAAMRHFRWSDKHMWYWNQRHRLMGLKHRMLSEESRYSLEYSDIILSAEGNYPIPIYKSEEHSQKEEEPNEQG